MNLTFGRNPNGSLSLTLQSPQMIGIRSKKLVERMLEGNFYFGDLAQAFTLNSRTGKSAKGTEAAITLSFTAGRAVI